MDTNKEKITVGTIARTIVLGLALLNQILMVFGIQAIPVEDDTINTLISTGWTVVSAVVAWWKNNSFSQDAIKLDKELHEARKAE